MESNLNAREMMDPYSPVIRSRAEGWQFPLRFDPFHETTNKEASTPTWFGPHILRHRISPNSMGVLRYASVEIRSTAKQSQAQIYSTRAIEAMSVLEQLGHATTYQMACLLGVSYRISWQLMSVLHGAGLVQRSIGPWFDLEGSGSSWRIDRWGDELEDWLSNLSNLDWALVTSGNDIYRTGRSGQATSFRHNMVSVEILIRAMEAIPEVVGYWGEQFATDRALVPVDEPREDTCVGDGVIVLRNGGVIILEVTTSAIERQVTYMRKIAEKAARWARFISGDAADAGVHVLFVDAGNLTGRTGKLRPAISRGIRNSGVSPSRVSDALSKIHYIDTQHWFPLPRVVAERFRRLDAWSYSDGRYHSLLHAMSNIDMPTRAANVVGGIHVPRWVVNDLEECLVP